MTAMNMAALDSIPLPKWEANPQPKTKAEVLDAFDASVAKVRATLPALDDSAMQGTWKAVKDGRDALALPRGGMLRMILLSHWIQHRGQLSVYLRLLGENVPASYGPSADEPPTFLSGASGASSARH